MKAIVVDSETPGNPLHWEEVPEPVVGADDVLVDIAATAVNRADLLQRSGNYPPPPGAPETLGLEMAGVVSQVGERVPEYRIGDRVCGLLGGGGYAERVALPHGHLLRIPEHWDLATAAAVPEVFLTAYINLFGEADLQNGETVLIHGGASGVGTAAIQLARAADCRVLVTAGTEAKRQRCMELGAELAVDYRNGFIEPIREHLGGDGADVILDVAGASHLGDNMAVMARQGRLIVISVLGGTEAQIDLGLLLRQRLRLIGSLLRSRPSEEKSEIVHSFRRRFWADLEEGRIEAIIHTVLPIEEAERAHAILEANENIGKVIMEIRR
ncbi:MAG: NAD(P)H-quinone oxidoreductase [Candidatus Latescibacterota bacterium]|nr:NAD(P)H-quinone oxidoreductase [Candidatus Latescibacterota bacterium]